MGNMGAPPSLNLISEILRLVAVLNSRIIYTLPVIFITGLAVAYTLILYARSQQGQFRFRKINFSPLTFQEMSLMALHAFFGLILRFIMGLII